MDTSSVGPDSSDDTPDDNTDLASFGDVEDADCVETDDTPPCKVVVIAVDDTVDIVVFEDIPVGVMVDVVGMLVVV